MLPAGVLLHELQEPAPEEQQDEKVRSTPASPCSAARHHGSPVCCGSALPPRLSSSCWAGVLLF